MDIDPPAAEALEAGEAFIGLEATVLDCWRFAMSDLRTNNVRGYLAEFLVARAVGATGARIEWGPWDITAPDGTKIEVKASSYLQAWKQRRLSVPTFRVAPAYGWDAGRGAWTDEQGYHADVYVFCLHTATRHEEYHPLDVAPWRFYVAPRSAIEAREGARMGLSALTRIAGEPVPYEELRSAIHAAATGSST
jgi:hypothetical protein